eukprot:CAMPEP_0184486354 /NCGR_PEP_ID=MMETSP0113_2-20130426/7852_1 /TAXON_ID=91329 /ORGANISM="Norrisiella sphaerica, Strain BC52" /LENGTH=89 /DNA_ID=CAMNT_0026868181 /DNA_START=34 /DNA_END=303 /DNA_ORIENTATION=+
MVLRLVVAMGVVVLSPIALFTALLSRFPLVSASEEGQTLVRESPILDLSFEKWEKVETGALVSLSVLGPALILTLLSILFSKIEKMKKD